MRDHPSSPGVGGCWQGGREGETDVNLFSELRARTMGLRNAMRCNPSKETYRDPMRQVRQLIRRSCAEERGRARTALRQSFRPWDHFDCPSPLFQLTTDELRRLLLHLSAGSRWSKNMPRTAQTEVAKSQLINLGWSLDGRCFLSRIVSDPKTCHLSMSIFPKISAQGS